MMGPNTRHVLWIIICPLVLGLVIWNLGLFQNGLSTKVTILHDNVKFDQEIEGIKIFTRDDYTCSENRTCENGSCW